MSAWLWRLSALSAAESSLRPIASLNRDKKKEPNDKPTKIMPVVNGRSMEVGAVKMARHNISADTVSSARPMKPAVFNSIIGKRSYRVKEKQRSIKELTNPEQNPNRAISQYPLPGPL